MIRRQQDRLSGGPSIEAGKRIYAIGDIHGRLDLLDRMLDAIDSDLLVRPHQQPRLVFLGDYIDRGPQSAGVVHRLIEVTETYDAVCLLGNHEALLVDFLAEPRVLDHWRAVGGLTTLLSYGVAPGLSPAADEASKMSADFNANLPASHRRFLLERPMTETSGDYLFVHAGLRPNCPLARQSAKDLLWIRDEFLHHAAPFEKFVVHGHTPVPIPDIRSNRINIDTGAFATGHLSCVVLEGDGRRLMQT